MIRFAEILRHMAQNDRNGDDKKTLKTIITHVIYFAFRHYLFYNICMSFVTKGKTA